MKTVSKARNALAIALIVACGSSAAFAQRARTVSDPSTTAAQTTSGTQTSQGVTTPKPPPAPPTVKAKYEGGIVGYRKSDGTLNFDDANHRLVFRDKTSKELFSVPYDVVATAWPDTHSRRSTTGTVLASTVPYGLGLPGLLMRNKSRYLVLQYNDPDTKAEGMATFKLQSKELLASVLYTFAEKAGLTQRGEAFVRRRNTATPATVSSQTPQP